MIFDAEAIKNQGHNRAVSKRTRQVEERLAQEMERDFDDPTAWEADPSPAGSGRPALGAQITVRLDEHLATRLRDIAQGRRVGYTALIRQWIEERLRWEDASVQLPLTYVEAGFSTTPPKPVDVKFDSRARVTVG